LFIEVTKSECERRGGLVLPVEVDPMCELMCCDEGLTEEDGVFFISYIWIKKWKCTGNKAPSERCDDPGTRPVCCKVGIQLRRTMPRRECEDEEGAVLANYPCDGDVDLAIVIPPDGSNEPELLLTVASGTNMTLSVNYVGEHDRVTWQRRRLFKRARKDLLASTLFKKRRLKRWRPIRRSDSSELHLKVKRKNSWTQYRAVVRSKVTSERIYSQPMTIRVK